MFIMRVGGKVESIFNSYALHGVQTTWFSNLCFQYWYQWFDFQQMWQWPLQWSAPGFELSEEEGKKIQHATSLVAASEKPWMRNFFFQTCFPVDKFSSRDRSLLRHWYWWERKDTFWKGKPWLGITMDWGYHSLGLRDPYSVSHWLFSPPMKKKKLSFHIKLEQRNSRGRKN